MGRRKEVDKIRSLEKKNLFCHQYIYLHFDKNMPQIDNFALWCQEIYYLRLFFFFSNSCYFYIDMFFYAIKKINISTCNIS